MKNNNPLVSIIVTTKNAVSHTPYFAKVLKSIKSQSYKNIELIVSDNFSTDNTVKVAKSFGATVFFKGPERTTQMNYAARKAKGKYIAVTGDDMIFSKNYIREAVGVCESGFDAVYHSTLVSEGNFWVKVRGLERLSYVGDDSIECAWFWKKKVYFGVGGYNPSMVAGEDFDLQERLDKAGYKTGRTGIANLHMGEPVSLKEIFKKNFYYGTTVFNYLKGNLSFRARKMFPVRKAFLKNWRLFLGHPFLSIGLILYKFLQYFAAGLGLLYSILKPIFVKLQEGIALMSRIKRLIFSSKHLEVFIIFCFSLVVFGWTTKGEVINGNDTTYPLRPVEFFQQRLYQWNHTIGGGIDFAHGSAGLSWHGLQAIPSLFKISLTLSQKIFLLFLFNCVSFSFYFFISSLLPRNKPAQLLGVVFYCFNPYLFNLWGNIQSANLCAYILIPLGSGFIIRSLSKNKNLLSYAVLFALISTLFSAYASNPQVLAVVLIYFFLFILFIFFDLVLRLKSVSAFVLLKTLFTYLIVYLIFNLFWIVPEIRVVLNNNLALNVPQSSDLRGWLDFVSANTNFVNVIRLQGEWMWYQSHKGTLYIPFSDNYKSNPYLIAWSFTSFAVSIWSIIKSKSRWIILFTVVLFIGLFASMGTKPPFGYLYLFLTQKIKVFSFMRSPWYKFSLLTVLAYGVLAAYFINLFGRKKAIIFSIILILGQMIYSYPLINGEIFPVKSTLPYKYKIPNYISGTGGGYEYLSGDLQESKVVMLPRQGDLDYYQWGGNSSAQLLNLMATTKPILTEPSWTVLGDTNINQIVRAFYDYLYNGWSKEAIKILSPLNVKYLLVKGDFNYDFDKDLGSPAFVREKLKKIKYIQDFFAIGPWDFHKIEKDKITPFIYVTNKADLVNVEPYLLANYFIVRGEDDSISISSDNITDLRKSLDSISLSDCGVGLLKEEIVDFSPAPAYIRFSPYHLFYRFSRLKEKKKLASISAPLEKAATLVFFNGKRINEVQMVLNSKKKKPLQKTVMLLTDYAKSSYEVERILKDYQFNGSRKEIEFLQTIKYYCNDSLVKLKSLSPTQADLKEAIEITDSVYKLAFSILGMIISQPNIVRHDISVLENGIYNISLIMRGNSTAPEGFNLSSIEINGKNEVKNDIKKDENIVVLGDYPLTKGNNSIDLFLAEPHDNNIVLVAKGKKNNNNENLVLPGVIFTKINPTEYKVYIDKAQDKYILAFLENYHPWWKAKIQLNNGRVVKLSKNSHLKINGFANGWIIDEKGDYEIIIEYQSQKTYELLIETTLILILTGIFYLLLINFKKNDSKKI